MMNKKSQRGIALIWIIIAGTLLIAGVGAVVSRKKGPKVEEPQPVVSPTPISTPISTPTPEQVSKNEEDLSQQEPLLKILPPKERAELESAIRETQRVLQNVEIFDYTPPSIGDITKGLDQINKQTQEQIQKSIEKQQQEFQQKYQQEIDLKKIEEYFNQNPPAVPQEGKEFSPAEKEYYYRKNILKDPAFQW